ncbi:MAG: MFS transporter [Gemmatimonadetes bacterium]|nr:MFS transporter [Gemmatimonadota bacterium]
MAQRQRPSLGRSACQPPLAHCRGRGQLRHNRGVLIASFDLPLCRFLRRTEVIVRSLAGPFGFLRGNILVLTASGSLGMFSRAMVFPYVPLYVLALGGESEQVGIVYALGPLGGLLAFPIAGYLADHTNRAWLIAAAGYFSAVAVLINAVAPSCGWLRRC